MWARTNWRSVLVPWWKYYMLFKKSHLAMININAMSFQSQKFPLTQCRDKNYWLCVTLCVVFSLLIYLSHTPTQDMFKLLGKLMTSNLNDRQDYLMINSNSIISNWVQLAVCQIDTEGGMCSIYILYSCIILKSCGCISLLFMYWSNLQWCNTIPWCNIKQTKRPHNGFWISIVDNVKWMRPNWYCGRWLRNV